jgi:hypothetical protein
MSGAARHRAVPLIALLALSAAGCAAPLVRATVLPDAAAALADADSVRVTEVAPGVSWTAAHYASGPWSLHVLDVDGRACVPVLDARKPGPPLGARATTSALSRDAIAAINADFFMLPGGTPVSAHVRAGVPLIGPGTRPIFAVTPNGWRIGTPRLVGSIAARGDSARVTQINRRTTNDGITLFSAWHGDSVAADTAALRLVLRRIEGDEGRGRGIVVRSTAALSAERIDASHVVVHAHGTARDWARRRTVGDTVTWSAQVVVTSDRGGDDIVHEAVGGFPHMLDGGRDVLTGQDVRPDFGERRHPRTAIGWTPDGRLLLVVVDGRQLPASDGMSLPELAWLFRRLGASHALNLDGGGSSAMVLRGTVVNRPSDPQGERAVGNILALSCR